MAVILVLQCHMCVERPPFVSKVFLHPGHLMAAIMIMNKSTSHAKESMASGCLDFNESDQSHVASMIM